jgi:P pilus assembly/Cpx signaling pathway, periplasmic inhibitor/zinc-resistance associated protein
MKVFKVFLLTLLIGMPAMAAETEFPGGDDKADFEKWFQEVREFKHRFMVRELNLNENQKEDFFRILDRMEDEMGEANRNARRLEDEIRKKGDNATAEDYEKAAYVLFEQKQKEGEIEQKAYNEFKKVLTPEQLFKFKGADWKFNRGLMDKHRRLKAGNAPKHDQGRRRDKKQTAPGIEVLNQE